MRATAEATAPLLEIDPEELLAFYEVFNSQMLQKIDKELEMHINNLFDEKIGESHESD